jgi:hypothetical protein
MSTSEAFPPTSEEALFQPDGTLNEDFLYERFGIGTDEALQIVTFGAYTGTVAQMLADEKCPVGSMLSTAYVEHGIDGVSAKLKTLEDLDPGFSVKITETTLRREQVKKKKISQ